MESPTIRIAECMEILGKRRIATERYIRKLASIYPEILIPVKTQRMYIRRNEFYKAIGYSPEVDLRHSVAIHGRQLDKLEKDVRRAVVRIQAIEDSTRKAKP